MAKERENKKNQLENTIKSVTNAIENQISDYKNQSKNILVIGGIVITAYAFYKLFSDSDDNNEIKESKDSSVVGSAITGIATTLLLTLAKDRLLKLLEKFNETDVPK